MGVAVVLVMLGTAGDYLALQCIGTHLSTAANGRSDASYTVMVALVVNVILGMHVPSRAVEHVDKGMVKAVTHILHSGQWSVKIDAFSTVFHEMVLYPFRPSHQGSTV